ncbi:PilN domain-containing protein [Ramlibacter sp. WS9]|uniref:PilN domain-containing protein n=1 Tax=Ramlibacter sp. WS9 TaxID=1882741 RepID=UPI001142046A|nr:PilN domain-containing protein [Ramlibacter sp. WS9]ROZ68589.1 hypothetical protein EEB15_25235 [Ramlibacter sp. WS9]
MSQQINLLQPKDRSANTTAWMLAGVGVVLIGLLVNFQAIMSQTNRLRETAAAGQRQLVQLRAVVQAVQQKSAAQGDPAALAAEISALRPRADAMGQLVREVRAGSLGSPQGFSQHYRTLAAISEDGVWLTSVTVTKGGGSVSISGRALRSESVMAYARRLNEAFGSTAVRFNSLELTPENVAKPGAPNAAPALAVIAFKLS